MKLLLKMAQQQGWRHDLTSKNHHRLLPPPGQVDRNGYPAYPVIFAGTPSDHRSFRNGLATLRRFGFDDEGRF